jgi:hypothetical protein
MTKPTWEELKQQAIVEAIGVLHLQNEERQCQRAGD